MDVTGITVAKALAIQNGSVVSGFIAVNGHLTLVRGDATQFDAGNVTPNSIVSAAINGSGHLIFTKFDATTIDVGQLSAQIDVFTASGTWSKPTGAKLVKAFALGGGGSGGGGAAQASLATQQGVCGGGGGQSGGLGSAEFLAADLGATETVTVGAGAATSGTGGTSTTTAPANGGAGTAGGNSLFGSGSGKVVGMGGSAGLAGLNEATSPSFPVAQPSRDQGGIGGLLPFTSTAGGIVNTTSYTPGAGIVGGAGAGGSCGWSGTDVIGNWSYSNGQNGGVSTIRPNVAAGTGATSLSTGGTAGNGNVGASIINTTTGPIEGGASGCGGGGASFRVGGATGACTGGNGASGLANTGQGGGGGGAAGKAAVTGTCIGGNGGLGGSGKVIVVSLF